jgi:hypothetical protein
MWKEAGHNNEWRRDGAFILRVKKPRSRWEWSVHQCRAGGLTQRVAEGSSDYKIVARVCAGQAVQRFRAANQKSIARRT